MKWQPLDLPACKLAESPRYAHGCWTWVDIDTHNLYQLKQADPFRPHASQLSVTQLPDEIGCVLPTSRPDIHVALGRKGGWLIEQGECLHRLAPPFDPNKLRFNDGRADAQGRIWISTLVDARTPTDAALYCIENGKPEVKVPGLIVGNGLAFSPDGSSVFLSDTRHRCIWKFEFDATTGALGSKTLVKQYTDGTARPDGACFSADGSYWVAVLEGYRLDRFGSEGHFIESIELPLAKPTMPCFGGEQGNILLLTAASTNERFPNRPGFENISLIACETSLTGMPEAFANPAHLG